MPKLPVSRNNYKRTYFQVTLTNRYPTRGNLSCFIVVVCVVGLKDGRKEGSKEERVGWEWRNQKLYKGCNNDCYKGRSSKFSRHNLFGTKFTQDPFGDNINILITSDSLSTCVSINKIISIYRIVK